jgi:hypothetical protein
MIIGDVKEKATIIADKVIDGLNKKCCDITSEGCGKARCNGNVVGLTMSIGVGISKDKVDILAEFIGLILMGSGISNTVLIKNNTKKNKRNKKLPDDCIEFVIEAERMDSDNYAKLMAKLSVN